MNTIKYFGDNIYTGNISKLSDFKYVNAFNFNHNFITEKSIIIDSGDNAVNVCFYKNKGVNIFPFGEYKEKNIKFSNKTFYRDYDFNHNLDNISGYKSSCMFLGSFEALLTVAGNCGIKISFSDVYNVVFSFWVYINNNILYVKNNDSVLYNVFFKKANLSFGIYNNILIVNSEDIITINGNFLPYNFFVYGNISELYITSKFFIPLVFEGTGNVIDDIYGDAYCITKAVSSLGYLKSKANNVLTLCDNFAFDIAFRAVGHSVPFSISNGVTFSGSNFVMNNASVWVDFDAINNVFYGNILTTSGVLTISGIASRLNDYYLMRCYYKDNKFGTILNGINTWTTCNNVTIFGGFLNILTHDTLIIDSFALYNKNFPTQDSYDKSLNKLIVAVSGTALVNSYKSDKILFGVDNFFPKNNYYVGTYSGIGGVPIFSSDFVYYTQYSLAGGEAELNNDYFYANKLSFKENVYNCFVCENDKTFLTYFSSITVPVNKILAESFTNYEYANDNFVTTNSGLYIRNYSKVFNPINSASIIEFSDIGWTNFFSFGVLFGIDSIPGYPNENCVAVTGDNISYIGTTTFSDLNINNNNSVYFYIDDSYITISGSDTGILCSGIVTSGYDYIRYFVKSGVKEECFSYRNLIVLDKPTLVDNYQIRIDLPVFFDYSKVRSNGEDLRFYSVGEQEEELNYWIENWNTSGISTIWVKITVSGTSEFYMYYGNFNVFSASNADNVFEFFDDFEGTSLDTDKWEVDLTQGGNYSVLDSQINIWATTAWRDVHITTKAFEKVELPIVVSAKVRSSNNSCGELFVGLYNSTIDKTYSITRDATCNWGSCSDGPRIKQTIYDASSSEDLFNMNVTTNDVWFKLTSKIRNDNKIEGYVDNISKGVSTKVIDSDGYCRVRFGTSSPCEYVNKHQYMDWIFIRKYSSYEPKVTIKEDMIYYKHHNVFAFMGKIYVSTTKRKINTLTNKFFSYALPEYYNLDSSYEELFYNIGNNVTSKGITIYNTSFYKCDCSFSTYYDATFSGMFNIYGYNFLGINDNFQNGFITERWRLVCSPYGVYSCNQPGWLNGFGLVDAVDVYATSTLVDPKTGFVILCDIDYYDKDWINVVHNYVSPTLSGENWPIRHIISIPPIRTSSIRVVPNGNWNEKISITKHASCFYNYGGTTFCIVNNNTCVHVALDDILYVYAEYNLEGSFDLSFSGINYYPLNSKLELKNYFGNKCYIETNWVNSSGCNITMSSGLENISTTISGFSNNFIYSFYASRNLDIINLVANVQDGDGGNISSNYYFSSDDIGLSLIFYNKNIPHAIGSGCLFDFKSNNYTVRFSSISAGYNFEALDGTDNISIAGVGFDTYPPNLFVDKIKGVCTGRSYMSCTELTSSGFQVTSDIIGDNIDVKIGTKIVGGIQQVSKFNRLALFSDYVFVPTISYKSYVIGKNKQYVSFSDISFFVKTGDKVYFYPGEYYIHTDKQITIIGIGNLVNIRLKIYASNGLTVIGCVTTKIQGSGVFNMYNCYILPWIYDEVRCGKHLCDLLALYDLIYINFYNCSLYNCPGTQQMIRMSIRHSHALLHKCIVCVLNFSNATIYDEGYSVRGCYDYGPEFDRANLISGLSHIDNIIVSNFYYNSIYNHFPLSGQLVVKKDNCSQLLFDNGSYSVYFYGDIKKLNSFSMYLFIQDLDGQIKIKNSSDFIFIVDSNNLNAGIHLMMNIYGLKNDIVVPISHSNVFRLAIVTVVFNGKSISIYLNGAKLVTKYIIVITFNDPDSYLDDSILFFDKTKFICDGNGLLLKGTNLKEHIDFLIGTHVEERYSKFSTKILVNMEFTTYPVLADYHGNMHYYGYVAHSSGVNTFYFNGSKSYEVNSSIAKICVHNYRHYDIFNNCIADSSTKYVIPVKKNSVVFNPGEIDELKFGNCVITDPYGYISLDLTLPMPVIKRSAYCFDIETSVVALSFDLSGNPYVHDVSSNQFVCHYKHHYYYCGYCTIRNGIFHNSVEWRGRDYCYIDHNVLLNLNSNFTIECLFSFYKSVYIVTKGVISYNIAYCVGINNRHIPYFKWSWEGDNIVYANKSIVSNIVTYLVVIVGVNTITFYINGKEAGIKYTDKLIIVNNLEELRIVSGYSGSNCYKNIVIEELCLSNRIKTKKEIENTWNKISGDNKELWIRLSSVVIISDKPIKTSPSDRFIETDNKIDTSKWEYTAYMKPNTDDSGGLILDSRKVKKIKSKVVSYNVIFDVSIFCEILNYNIDRNWSVEFRYKFSSENYISAIVNYIKNDDIYIKCKCYYNNYEESTTKTKVILSPCGIRFITDNNECTSVQIGDSNYWYSLWTSSQKLFVETCGWLEVILNNDDWDSWFIIKLTDFLPRLYCSSIVDGQVLNSYNAIPYGRSFYNQSLKNTTTLTLNNEVFEVDSTLANNGCVHSLEFINGQMPDLHVLNLNNNIFSNINYKTFNIELLVYLTYDNTCVLDLFPWININVKNKYLYIVMHDNDRTITDAISETLNNYIYIVVSLSRPNTTIYINSRKFIYDTNFVNVLPYHFYPIGKKFSGRVVYFCGYYDNFDEFGYKFRVSTLSRYIGFDNCGRKIFGNNLVTSLDSHSVIYAYNNPSYSALLANVTCNIVGWLAGWSKRIKLTILGSCIEENLFNFPVLIHLDSVCLGIFNELGSNSKRISVITSDKQQCYIEIEDWDETTKNAWLWVKVPTLVSGVNSCLYLYYDNLRPDNSDYVGTVGEAVAQNVWDSHFLGVWHMNQDPSEAAPQIIDSTSHADDGSSVGSMISDDLVDGKIGKAINFYGSNNGISCSTLLAVSSAITFEAEVKTVDTYDQFPIAKYNGITGAYINISQNGKMSIGGKDGSGNYHSLASNNTYDCSAFIYIAGTIDENLWKIYGNGVLDGTLDTGYTSTNLSNSDHLGLGYWSHNNSHYVNGVVDEVRISDIARSAAWLKTTYYSNRNQLLNYGYEETNHDTLDVKISFDPAVLQSLISQIIVIKCSYLNLKEKKTTSITLFAIEHNVNHNYYDSFGDIGNSNLVFSYNLIGTCYDNDSVFYLDIDIDILEKILEGKVILNIKNNETINITNIYIYLNGELSINETYDSLLLV